MESEICAESRFRHVLNSTSYPFKVNETCKAPELICVTQDNCLESNDFVKKYDAEIEVSVTKSSGRPKLVNTTHVFSKNYETIDTNIFEIEDGPNYGFPAGNVVLCHNSFIEDFGILQKSLGTPHNVKELLNNEQVNTQPMLYFNSEVPRNFTENHSHDCHTIAFNCGDKIYGDQGFDTIRNLVNGNESLEDIVHPKGQQTLRLFLDTRSNEYLDFDVKSVHTGLDDLEKTVVDNFEDSTNMGLSTDADPQLSSYVTCILEDNQNVDTITTDVLFDPEVPNYHNDSSTDYDTCSSAHMKSKFPKVLSRRNRSKDFPNKSPRNAMDRNTSLRSCENGRDTFQMKSSETQHTDLETGNSLDYYSQDSNDIIIPVPKFKTIAKGETFYNVANKGIDTENISNTKEIHIKHNHRRDTFNSTISETPPKDVPPKTVDYNTCSSLSEHKEPEISDSQKVDIYKLPERTINSSAAHTRSPEILPTPKEESTTICLLHDDEQCILNIILMEIIDYTWGILRDVICYIYRCGSSFTNGTNSAISGALVKFTKSATKLRDNRVFFGSHRKGFLER